MSVATATQRETSGLAKIGRPKTTFARGAIRSTLKAFSAGLKTGAGEGIRTLDPNLGKVVLYP
jgi:hypothetical protein